MVVLKKKKDIFLIIFISFVVLISTVIAIMYLSDEQSNISEEYVFPRDEGAHQGYDESWYVCFHLTSENGTEYGFLSQYAKRADPTHGYKKSVLVDIENDDYYFKLYKVKSDKFNFRMGKLNITYDYYYGIDRWYQLDDRPFEYYFSSGLLDTQAKPIILNCTMKSTKDPAILNDSLMNKYVFDDESNEIFYYVQSRVMVNGTLLFNGKQIPVSGIAWIDREWGEIIMTNVEWFAIQLDNGYEIAAVKTLGYNFTNTLAQIITPDGTVMDLYEDLEIITLNRTESGFSKEWSFISESENINLTMNVLMDRAVVKKHLVIGIFEGSCKVSGYFHDEYVEGYCFSEQNP